MVYIRQNTDFVKIFNFHLKDISMSQTSNEMQHAIKGKSTCCVIFGVISFDIIGFCLQWNEYTIMMRAKSQRTRSENRLCVLQL
jgi:hypothetical protein